MRVTAPLDRRLKARARATRKTESEVVRELLTQGLEDVELRSTREAEKLFGLIDAPGLPNGRDARRHLARWTPDRRG